VTVPITLLELITAPPIILLAVGLYLCFVFATPVTLPTATATYQTVKAIAIGLKYMLKIPRKPRGYKKWVEEKVAEVAAQK
jgi:hypothetical protein